MGFARRARRRTHVSLTMPPRPFRLLSSIAELPAERWDGLFQTDYPFVRHAFLNALETSGCVGGVTGWTPAHLVMEGPHNELLAACPLYLKRHSYGEFVFDFSWAHAAERAGMAYYPRFVTAIPFTPSIGPRWAAVDPVATGRLLTYLADLPVTSSRSSLHALFLDAEQAQQAVQHGALLRHDVQYHWRNQGYVDFEDFLSRLSADKRKKIRRERRKVSDAGIHFSRQAAAELSDADWDEIYALYASTYAMRGQPPYLSRAFFDHYRSSTDCPLWVVSGTAGGVRQMMALFLQSGDTLYGRHWGSRVELDGAHFETCYYQGIDWCIERGLRHFDAGTQGDHKRARGFEPVVTTSAHWIVEPRLRAAVQHFLQHEGEAVAAQATALQAHSAYRHAEPAP